MAFATDKEDAYQPDTLVKPMRVRHLRTLTGMRFYAALMVVLTHVTHVFLPDSISNFFGMGGVGVSFFFVLSGFVLTWSRNSSLPKRHFYRNRFARVYPLHAVTWLAAGGVILWEGATISIPVAASTLVLVQSWVPFESFYFGVNGPSWSLSCEAFFYAVFPFLAPAFDHKSRAFIVKTMVVVYVFVGAITLAVHVLLRGDLTVALLYVNPLYRLWEFALGIGLAHLFIMGWRTRITLRAAFLAATGMFALVSLLNVAIIQRWSVFAKLPMHALPSDIASFAMVPCFILLMTSAASAELRGLRSHLASRAAVTLGRWSFALYVSHLIVATVVADLIPDVSSLSVSLLLTVAVVLAALVVAGLLYRFVEMPLERKLRSPRAPARMG